MDSFELKPELEAEIDWFSLGCVVDDNTFVNHFRSESKPSIYYSKTFFSNYKKRFFILFKTFTETDIESTDPELVSNFEDWTEERFEFSINYSKIKSIDVFDNQMVIKLTFPPLLYTIVDDVFNADEEYDNQSEEYNDSGYEGFGFDDTFSVEDTTDVNIIEYERSYDFYGLRLRTTKLFDENEDIFTKINSIRIVFKDKSCLSDIISNIKVFEPLIAFNDILFDVIDCKSLPIDLSQVFGLPFAVKYSLEALFNHSFQLIDSLDYFGLSFDQFVDSVKELSKIDEKCVENSLNDLRVKIENNEMIKPLNDLHESFVNYRKEGPEKWTNSSVVMIRRCILTPTRLLLLPALPLQESRFLRTADPEYVIRLLIKDEDFQLFSFTTCKASLPEEHEINYRINSFLFDKIVDRLKNGITIAGRTYELIGASTSQLRDHGLVLYACDDLKRNAITIRQLIGKIDSFRNSAKFIARIGQSMSQSMGFIPNIDCIEMIDDIKGGVHSLTGKPFTFSDGVGMISQQMSDELCSALKISSPSAFQIRYAGFKGVLVLNPELKGRKILLRPSMKKFESDSTDLDVLKVSEPRSCYLNRPLITILNQMGVTNDRFLELLFNRHKQLADAFDCSCKAIRLIRNYSGLDFGFKVLLDSGIDILKEPFFVETIQSVISKVSLDLKNKARVLIPFDSSRVMYGVMDETRTLKYGQVFVQYTHKSSGEQRVLEGEVLVTKFPCMHAGDVRKLEAIDVPALHHIVDCIVFPADGERPHPDEMAGSDLDGDEYSVIWYKPLIFDKKNYPPMYFPSGEAEDLGRAVTNEDILKFYCRFIAHNQVGLIAHSHLVWADSRHFGIKCNLCERLAYKYAVALDYAKTGINARLCSDQKPNLYPDFMMKSNEKPTYKSIKALGKLFQKNCFFHEVINELTEENIGFDLNPMLIHERADTYMENARHMYRIYENSIKELKDKFGIESESSLVSSTFKKTHKYLCTHNDNDDIYELVTNISKRLFNDLLLQFEAGVSDEEELLAKASAWYQVSHEMNGRKSGFPWIVTKYLAKLAKRNGSTKHVCGHSSEVLSNCEQLFPKETILNILNKILRNSLNIIFGLTFGLTQNLKNKFETLVEKYESEDKNGIPLSVLTELFIELSEDIEDYEKDYDIAIICLMANMKIRRLGLKNALIYENTIDCEQKDSSNKCLSVAAISGNVANIFSDDNKIDDPMDSLISRVKALTGVTQLVIRYGAKGHESHICVYGSQGSVKRFKEFITQRYLESELKNLTQLSIE